MKNVERTLVREVFEYDVIGTLTGRRMSTPDADKPALVEVRIDSTKDNVWVPEHSLSTCEYAVKLTVDQEGYYSPTDAVLSMIDWLRSPNVGGVTFTVEGSDQVTYLVYAEQDASTQDWRAEVTDAKQAHGATSKPRPDLVSTEDDA